MYGTEILRDIFKHRLLIYHSKNSSGSKKQWLIPWKLVCKSKTTLIEYLPNFKLIQGKFQELDIENVTDHKIGWKTV